MAKIKRNQILGYLRDNEGEYCTAEQIASSFNISVRTVKNHISELKELLADYPGLALTSVASKGYVLNVSSPKEYQQLVDDETINSDSSFNDVSFRIKSMANILLSSRTPVSKYDLMSTMAVSERTLYTDLREMQEILNKYQLQIVSERNRGFQVTGNELDKRRCIAEENMLLIDSFSDVEVEKKLKEISSIKELLVNLFSKHYYHISESALESLTIHLLLTITRIEKGFYVKDRYEINDSYQEESLLAKEIFDSYHLSGEEIDNEIRYLAINLKGKRDYTDNQIPEEISELINQALQKIEEEYYVNFVDTIDLKTVLSMHLIPLLERARLKKQLENDMLLEIKNEFPFAFDIASFFCRMIESKYKMKILIDEVGYFTLYFNYALENIVSNDEGKKILIVSAYRVSEMMLLKQKLLSWFKKQIAVIDIVHPMDLEKTDISKYDAVCTTSRNDKNQFVFVDVFPSEKDRHRIDIVLNGYSSAEDILGFFSEDLFYETEETDRNKIVDEMIRVSSMKYGLIDNFRKAVEERENTTSTYFANGVAMPHPMYPVSKQSFITAVLFKKPVQWDAINQANLALLVSTEAGNPLSFRIWQYISFLTTDEEATKRILDIRTYENFITVMREYISRFF